MRISAYNTNNRVNFGVKIPTQDAISLATQRYLSKDFKDILEASSKITERKNNTHDLIACGDQCRDGLLKQFPILKEIRKNADDFFKNTTRTNKEIDAFVEKQIEKVGAKEIDVEPIKIQEHVYQEFNSEIAKNKPVISVVVK